MKRTLLIIVACLLFVNFINSQSSPPTTSTASVTSTPSASQTPSDSPTPNITPSSSSLISLNSQTSSTTSSSSETPSASSSGSSSASPSLMTSTIPNNETSRTYAIQFQPFTSASVDSTDSLISFLKQALVTDSIYAASPFSKRDTTDVQTVYVYNVTGGSAFENRLTSASWLPEFNNISNSNVPSSDVSVFQVFAAVNQTSTASLSSSGIPSISLPITPSTSPSPSISTSRSRSVSPSPSPLANINIAVTFPNLVTRVINDTEELIYIFAETLNISESRITEYTGNKRDIQSTTVVVNNNTPAFAAFISNPANWIARFNELADINTPITAADIQIRQLNSPTPSTLQTPSAAPAQGSCPFNFPYNSTTGVCVLPGATLYLPFTGPMASSNLPDPTGHSLTVCITVNSPDCMVNPPITGRRQMNNNASVCSQPFSRFWSQWDACLYDFAPYTVNQTFIDESNVANTCAANTTTTQISYLGAYYGNWSFSQQPCYNTNAKRQSPSEQCFCVPYPDASSFGVNGRVFFTELSVYQTDDSGVPASIRIICNDFACANTTTGLLPPNEWVRYDSSNERALILGIVLGFGLPCLIYCICAIIIAILILLLLLLLGKSTTAKTFWVPSRDDL